MQKKLGRRNVCEYEEPKWTDAWEVFKNGKYPWKNSKDFYMEEP